MRITELKKYILLKINPINHHEEVHFNCVFNIVY